MAHLLVIKLNHLSHIGNMVFRPNKNVPESNPSFRAVLGRRYFLYIKCK